MEDLNNQQQEVPLSGSAVKPGISKRFRKTLRILILIVAVVFAALMIISILSRPYNKTSTKYTNVMVEEGDKIADVSEKLEEAGVISDADTFRFISRLLRSKTFKPGMYYLSPSMNMVEIYRTLANGLTTPSGFTIPPGYNTDQIATALERDGFIDKKAFLKAAGSDFFQDIDFIGDDISGPQQIEGFLFPASYSVDSLADESMIIMTMLNEFSNFFNEDYRARAEELGMSVREVIVIASIIETETGIDKEKATISSVIHNRINLDMADDLPEVPLCSPGPESIIAALYPEETEYVYYVLSDKLNGTHVFTADEDEYNAFLEAYQTAAAAREEANAEHENAESGE